MRRNELIGKDCRSLPRNEKKLTVPRTANGETPKATNCVTDMWLADCRNILHLAIFQLLLCRGEPLPTLQRTRAMSKCHLSGTCMKSTVFTVGMTKAEDRHAFDETCDDADEDEEILAPYKSRSLSWTNRYRKLIPYESARARAMSLGLRSKAEWDDFQESGEARRHGPYLPSRPDLMYPDDWVNWDEFLGVMRPYDEARELVRTLGIQNWDEYELFIRNDKKRAEGLRIPAKPHIVYRNTGWTTVEDFFGGFD